MILLIINKYLQDLSTQFKDKVVIVTEAHKVVVETKLFAHRGAMDYYLWRNEKQGLEIKSEIESIGSKCIFVKADLNEEEDCLEL